MPGYGILFARLTVDFGDGYRKVEYELEWGEPRTAAVTRNISVFYRDLMLALGTGTRSAALDKITPASLHYGNLHEHSVWTL